MLRSPKEERPARPKTIFRRRLPPPCREAIGNAVLSRPFTEGQSVVDVGVCGSGRLGEPSRASFTELASRRGDATAGCGWEGKGAVRHATLDLVRGNVPPAYFAGEGRRGNRNAKRSAAPVHIRSIRLGDVWDCGSGGRLDGTATVRGQAMEGRGRCSGA